MLQARGIQLLRRQCTALGWHNPLYRSFGHHVNMILKEDMEKLGNRGDSVRVKAGYARNFLYPQKLAVYATEANLAKKNSDQESAISKSRDREREIATLIKRISKMTIVFHRETSSKNDKKFTKLIRAEDISDLLEKQHALIVGSARIQLSTPIKTIGEHVVKIRVDEHLKEELKNSQASVNNSNVVAKDNRQEAENPIAPKTLAHKQEISLRVHVVRR